MEPYSREFSLNALNKFPSLYNLNIKIVCPFVYKTHYILLDFNTKKPFSSIQFHFTNKFLNAFKIFAAPFAKLQFPFCSTDVTQFSKGNEIKNSSRKLITNFFYITIEELFHPFNLID